MDAENILCTVKWNLCSGCGICVGVCPKKCLSWKYEKGMYYPYIDANSCISCGICKKVCPGLSHRYEKNEGYKAVEGKILISYSAWSKSPEIRHVSASGGVVSSIIQYLLENKIYDRAFLVDSYDYHQQVLTRLVTVQDVENISVSDYPKSRYIPVSHENAIAYMKSNRSKKVILIGTSCAIRGFTSAIELLNLKRENYLMIGLFCDRVFNYNVADYYQQSVFCHNKKLEKLHFKNKESGGWPGNMKFIFTDGTVAYQDKAERVKIKDYFMPERCLYCIDKLNVYADISVGDNYTQQDSSLLGSNSVIIRTDVGMAVWNRMKTLLEYKMVSVEKIMKAQYIDGRLNNFYYGKLKEKVISKKTGEQIVLNEGIIVTQDPQIYRKVWKNNLNMLKAGETYRENPKELQKQMKAAKKKRKSGVGRRILKRGYRCIKYWITKGE